MIFEIMNFYFFLYFLFHFFIRDFRETWVNDMKPAPVPL